MKRFFFVSTILVLASCTSSSPTPSLTTSVTSPTIQPTTTTIQSEHNAVPKVPAEDGLVEISVTVGIDTGPNVVFRVPLNSSVRISILNLDQDDEFHLHGYELGGEVTPAGETAVFELTVDVAGTFEIESHEAKGILLTLIVE